MFANRDHLSWERSRVTAKGRADRSARTTADLSSLRDYTRVIGTATSPICRLHGHVITLSPASAENKFTTAQATGRCRFGGLLQWSLSEAVATTYVIGAGASRHAQYPLASEMGQGVIHFMLGMQAPFPQQARHLTQRFGAQSNIEEMITELGSLIQSGQSTADPLSPVSPGNLWGFLGFSLREWFRQIHLGTADAYAEFAETIAQPGDMIITFNYDDSLERELKRAGKWDVSDGYGFPFAALAHPSQVFTLKLHGSMNWLWPVPLLGQRPLIHRADLTHLGYSDFTNFTGYVHANGGAIPCLILPDREKKFFYETSFGIECREFWDDLWEQARDAVKRSERMVLCGYSLLPVDGRACALLLNEPEKDTDITVVSGAQNDRIASDFRDAGFQNVHTFESGYFEDWVRAGGVTS